MLPYGSEFHSTKARLRQEQRRGRKRWSFGFGGSSAIEEELVGCEVVLRNGTGERV